MRDSSRRNFWTKDGRQVALASCSRSSETPGESHPTPPQNWLCPEPLTFSRSKQICSQTGRNFVYIFFLFLALKEL